MKIDAVALKRRLQKEAEERLRGMSVAEQLEYYGRKFGYPRRKAARTPR